MSIIDLSDIDAYEASKGPRSLMATLVAGLDEETVLKLRAACGLVEGYERRQWTAIAKWLTATTGTRVSSQQVSGWASEQRDDG